MSEARTGLPGDLQDEGTAKSFMEDLVAQVRGLLEEDEPDGYQAAPNWPPAPMARSGEPDRPTQ